MTADLFPGMTTMTIAKEVTADNHGTRVIRVDMATDMASKNEDHVHNMVATMAGIQIAITNVVENATMEITDNEDITTQINTVHKTIGMVIPTLTLAPHVAVEYPTNKTEHRDADLLLCRAAK
jgi:hypothetical protein